MRPILIILFAATAGVPLGLWLRHNLASLGYRTADEADLPAPGPRRWVVWVSVIAIGSLAAAAVMSHNPLAFIPLIPLAVAGPWLAAVDFDLLRIPSYVLAPTAVATLLAIGGTAAATQEWRTFIVPAAAAAVLTGGAFAAVHFASKGGIGFGDVKLATLIALAVGPLGIGAVWLGVLAGSVIALAWAKTTHRIGPIPFGPWLLSGSWLAALATALSQ